MRRLTQVALLASVSALTSAALAFDNGQHDGVSPDIRAARGVNSLNLAGDIRRAAYRPVRLAGVRLRE
jgi:hypothetical protein